MKPVCVLVGNPNCGKTTLFNRLTHSSRPVGNRAGVTVSAAEVPLPKTGYFLRDLPGIYSFHPDSPEEALAKKELCKKEDGPIINIIDGSCLSRNLYLTLSLLFFHRPMILAVNMVDEMKAQGIHLDLEGLSRELGVQGIFLCARTGEGIDSLLSLLNKPLPVNIHARNKVAERLRQLETSSPLTDPEEIKAQAKYQLIEELLSRFSIVEKKTKSSLTRKIDQILLHPLLALPAFALIMLMVFYCTFGVPGTFLTEGVKQFVERGITDPILFFLKGIGTDRFLLSLISQGIFSGMGLVLSFLPQILLLFFFLSLLEDTGYMPRIAFILDRPLRALGLSGKSFIPFLLGFGCTTPAVMAARTISHPRTRRLTVLLTPFMSCSAKLPIYALFTGVFFQEHRPLIFFFLYFSGLFLALSLSFFLKHTLPKTQEPPFISELPPYRLPTLASTMKLVWEKAQNFLVRAGTLIFFMSIVIWILNHFTLTFGFTESPSNSILAALGRILAPLFAPLGFGTWQASVSLLAGLAAKETVVSSLGVLYGAQGIANAFSPAGALSYLVFCLLYIPCLPACISISREMNSPRWTAFSVLLQTGIAYLASFFTYRLLLFIHILS